MTPRNLSVERLVLVLLVGLGLLGGVLILVATPDGVGANGDSAAYLLAARSVMHGEGVLSFATIGPIESLTEPLVWWPPFLPLVLAGLGSFGLDPFDGVHLLNALLFAFNIGLVGWLVWRLSGSVLATAVASILILGAPHILVLHAMAWSEPLFLALVLVALTLLAHYLTGGTRWLLLAVALLAAAATLTRYVGMVFILLGGLALLVWPGRSLRRRFVDAISFGVVGALPIGLWMMRNFRLMGTTNGRLTLFHPPTLVDLKRATFTFLSWLAPVDVVDAIWPLMLAVLGLIVLALAVFLWRARRHWTSWIASWWQQFRAPMPFSVTLVYLLIGFGGAYVLSVLGSITLFDAFVSLDSRVLSPVYVAAVIVGVGLGGRLLTQPSRLGMPRWLPLGVSGLLGLLAISYVLQGVGWVTYNHATGANLGVSGKPWHQSPLVALVEDLPPETKVSTNHQESVYVLTGRVAYRLPIAWNPVTSLENPNYETMLRGLGDWLGAENGVVAYFVPESRPYIAPVEDLEAMLNICRTVEVSDGFLYYLCPPENG